jgi:uncharacterized protein (DUF983 family)
MFTHGSGGQIVVLLVIVLITAAFLLWTYSQGTLKQHLWLVVLLVAMLVVQLLLFYRIRTKK